MRKIRILLIDDHVIVRRGLTSLLGTRKDFEVVGDAGDGPSGIQLAIRTKPDVVITDLMMPGMDGVETTRELIKALPDTKVLILTTFGAADGIAHALEAGASGAISKDIELNGLAQAIRDASDGKRVLSPEIERILNEHQPSEMLSARQQEILDSVTRGLSNEDIAREFGISVPTVKDHLKYIFAKIGAANRTEAVAIALRRHLLKT